MSEFDKAELRRLVQMLRDNADQCACAGFSSSLQDKAADAVLSLLDENEQFRNQLRLAGISAELTVRDQVGRAVTSQFSAEIENAQLRAEVEALRKDAERYRWLRQRAGVDHMCGDYRAYVNTEKMTDLDLETTDAAIDAAMAKEGDANG